jgi:hypothetical protein
MKRKLASALLVAVPALASAQTLSIESGLSRAVPYVVGVGMGVSAIGLVFAGIKFSNGDPQAKESAKSVLIGSVLIMSASAIIGLVKTLFPSS